MASYIVPELLENDYSVVEKLYKKYSELKKYEVTLKNIFRTKNHVLSKKEEYIISKLTAPYGIFEDAYTKLTDVDLKFGKITYDGKKEELNDILYYALTEHKNRNVRKKAFKQFYDGFKSVVNTNAELINGNVKANNLIADVRKYNSALERSLDSNDINPTVYDTLLDSINKNINTIHKQWDVLKKVLKLMIKRLFLI